MGDDRKENAGETSSSKGVTQKVAFAFSLLLVASYLIYKKIYYNWPILEEHGVGSKEFFQYIVASNLGWVVLAGVVAIIMFVARWWDNRKV